MHTRKKRFPSWLILGSNYTYLTSDDINQSVLSVSQLMLLLEISQVAWYSSLFSLLLCFLFFFLGTNQSIYHGDKKPTHPCPNGRCLEHLKNEAKINHFTNFFFMMKWRFAYTTKSTIKSLEGGGGIYNLNHENLASNSCVYSFSIYQAIYLAI